jgi:hypothetical protein
MQMQSEARQEEAPQGVDENGEMLHTLSSSRLTNKTICRKLQGSTEYSSLTINSR